MNAKQNIKGFTIIEVVLVLAIAGLIFLMVFIALPALQAGQRDTARKNDVSAVASAVNTYVSNNRGTFPTTAAQVQSYAQNVSGNTTTIAAPTARGSITSVTPADGTIRVLTAARCGAVTGANVAVSGGTARQFVVITRLEAGGGAAFCQDS